MTETVKRFRGVVVDDYPEREQTYVFASDYDALEQQLHAARDALQAEQCAHQMTSDLLREAREDADRYRFLTNLPKVQAQAFFWNWDSRKDRAKSIDAARAGEKP